MKVAIAFVSMVLMVIITSGCVQQEQKETIKIGADFSLTGNAARYGEWARNAMTLATDEINSQGGINGKKIELIFEDNRGQTSDAVTAYNKLKNVDQVRYISTFLSSVALSIATFANQDKIIQMDISSTTPLYSTPNDYTFRTGVVATQLAEEAANILFDNLSVKKVGIIYINNEFGKGMINVFKNSYKGEMVIEEIFNQDDTNFGTQLLKVKNANVSTVFLVCHIKEGGILVKQAKELGLNLSFFSDVYSVEGPEFINAAKDAADGLLYIAPHFDASDKNSASFAIRYKEEYREEPTVYAAQAYDGLIALAKAMQNCAYNDTDCVRTELMKLDYEGASGRIKFDINGDVQKPVELKTIVNETYVRYEG